MSTRLRDMIRAVRACKTAAEERAVIAKECASLRNAFKDNDHDYRHRNVAKLMFIHMLGYPTHFGQMECLKLIAAPGFPEKRIGYLGLMLLLDERQEVLMLVTNSLKNDLNHGNQFICGLALCALGNICSSEMARDLAPEVERLLSTSSNTYIRKKAALCSVRIVRKVPDLVDFFIAPVTSLLTDKHHGVLLAAVKLATVLSEASAGALEHFRKQTPVFVRILKNLVVSGYAPEHDVGGITDPFLQIRVLKLLKLVGKGDADASDIMSDILAQVATNTEANKNAGNAILYECVSTIMGVEAIGGLRVLAVNILGRFLANKDNNIRYVALNTLVKVVSIDTQAVQRHRSTIVECVKDSDVSIRKRALDLVYALVNDANVNTLTRELLEYLKVSDPEFKPDLTHKICALAHKFAPSKVWHLDTMVKVLLEAGEYVKEDAIRLLLVLIANAPELHSYAVRTFYAAMARSWKGQESLALVSVWCIGEYGEMLVSTHPAAAAAAAAPPPPHPALPPAVPESDVLSLLESVLRDVRSTAQAKAYTLLALLKLTSRLSTPNAPLRISHDLSQYSSSLVLELQQRSVEFSAILSRHAALKSALIDKIPALDEAAYRAKREDDMSAPSDIAASAAGTPNGASSSGNLLSLPAAAPSAPPPAMLMDLLDLTADDSSTAGAGTGGAAPPLAASSLLDLLGDAGPVAATGGGGAGAAAAAAPHAQPNVGTGMLLDLLSLGGGDSTATTAAAPAAPSAMASTPPVDPLAALMAGGGGGAPTSTAPAVSASAAAAAPDPFADFGFGGVTVAAPSPPAFPSIVALDKNGLKIVFEFEKSPNNPQKTTIKASYSNSSPVPLTDFVFQAAVPKYMQLVLEPASGSAIPASLTGSVTQTMQVVNSLHGQKSLVMKLRITYKADMQDVLEQLQVNNFPANL